MSDEEKTGHEQQSTREFLKMYGWVFLVLLVIVGALAYFGAINGTMFTGSYDASQDQCEMYVCNYFSETADLRIYREVCPEQQYISVQTTDGAAQLKSLEPQQHVCIQWSEEGR